MIQLTYVSNAAATLASDDLFRIIEISSRNNLRDELTGFLIFSRNRFFQLVEGPQQNIEALMMRLSRDPRHSNIAVVNHAAISARGFPRWQMKRLDSEAEVRRALADRAYGADFGHRLMDDLARFFQQVPSAVV